VAGAGCSGDDDSAATTTVAPGPTTENAVGPSTTAAPGETTTGPPEETTTPPTYIVPPIDPASVPEICEATKAVNAADTALSDLLTPLLASDDSPQADQALLAALPKVTPLITQAQDGYGRMAAVLPPDLAADAQKVSEATKSFYDSVVSSKTIEDAIAAVQNSAAADAAKESAAHIEATVKATCNLSLYS
jgi:hypothetical protein